MAGAGEGRAQLRFQDQPREPRLGSPEGISLEWRRVWACGPLVEAAEEAFGPAAGRGLIRAFRHCGEVYEFVKTCYRYSSCKSFTCNHYPQRVNPCL